MNFFSRNKEKILYLFFGGLTTLVSLMAYFIITHTLLNPNVSFELQVANIISWIAGFLFAFFTNHKYVFNSDNKKSKEFFKFLLARISTLFLDMLIMYIFVAVLKYNDLVIKLLSQGIIIVTNYFLSKLFVFKK